MANIILIMPIANRYDKVTIRIPNGLLAVASLPDKAGYSIKIIDLKLDDNWHNTLKQSIGKDTLCVGITCSTGRMINSALEVAGRVRKINPLIPIVWGGPHPTLLPEQTMENPLVDIVVINEGERIFMELIDALSTGKTLINIKGIYYKENGSVIVNSPAKIIEDLDELPSLPYHLVDISKYSSLNIDNMPSIDILTSRGCPNNCGFCSIPVTCGRRWRAISPEKIIQNIKELKEKYGIKTFYFCDDNFMVDLKRVERLLDLLKNERIDIYWGTQGVRIDTINQISNELIDSIEESGCVELSVGIESASSKTLEMIEKKITIKDVYEANKKLAGRNFAIKYNFIIGFPEENMDDVKKTVKLALDLYKENRNVWFPFNIFTPFPGTPMFNKAVEYGFNPPEKFEEWEKLESVGWDRYFSHWLGKNENSLLRSIHCTSYVAFPSALQKVSNGFLRFLFKLYQPVAFFRFSRMFYFLHLEKYILEKLD